MKPQDHPRQDFAVRELELSRPKLRGDLGFSFQEFRGERCCVVEDPVGGKFYRIGLREYHFIRRLDGRTPVGEAQAAMAVEAGGDALSESEVITVLRWLLETGLAATDESTRADLMFSRVEKKREATIKSWLNILFFKQSLGNPDRLIGAITRVLGFWAGRLGALLWSVLVLCGSAMLLWRWEDFADASRGVLAPDNWLWLGVAWVGLKLVHELWHGVICKFHGGSVPDAGVLFVLFTPMGYVDATSSWQFPDKWKRMHVSAAGMFIEIGIAAVAVLIWSQSPPGLQQTISYNIVIMATVVTFLFNANPLLKFDGYYIMADWLEIPNLYSRGQKALTDAARRFLIGIPDVTVIDPTKREEIFILAYGVAAFIWRIIVMITILTAASLLFGGGGIILAVVAGGMLVVPAVTKLYRYLREGGPGERPNPRVYAPRLLGIAAVLSLIALFPFRPTLTAPGITDFGDASILRVECPGFVQTIHLADGAPVREGDAILTLRNDEERARLRRLTLELKKAQIKARAHQTEGRLSASQIEEQNLEALRQQVREQQAYVDSLTLRAPAAGRLVGRDLPNLSGTFLRTGYELATVEQRRTREVKLAISQQDINLFRLHQDHPVWVKIVGRPGRFYGLIESPDPQASLEPPHPALTAAYGGPLLVRSAAEPGRDGKTRMQLLEPHFTGRVSLKERLDENLRSGERAIVKFTSRKSLPLWKWAYKGVASSMNQLSGKAQNVR